MVESPSADIPESYFEHKAEFAEPMFETWTVPNPLAQSLYLALQRWKITLGDISWNKDPNNYGDFNLAFNVRSLNAVIRVGLDWATFIAVNPDWPQAPALVELFEAAMNNIRQTAGAEIARQEMWLAMHVTPGPNKFGDAMSRLVKTDLLGAANMYGVSVYREDSSLVIDKSLRYEGGVFVRLSRKFPAVTSFSEIATTLYEDELNALNFLGLRELIEGQA